MRYDRVSFVSAGSFSTTDSTWIHPIRRSSFSELILVTSGELYLCENYNEFHLLPGSVIFLENEEKHYGTRPVPGGVSLWRVSFRNESDEELPLIGKTVQLTDFTRAADLCAQMEHDSLTPEYPAEVCDALLRLLLIELSVYGVKNDGDSLPVAICDYIRSHKGCVKVRDVAAHFEYNEDYITRVFKRIYDKGIKSYIDTVRLQLIRRWLADGTYAIPEIAEKMQFDDYAAFYSFFKYKTGMSPAAYRALYVGHDGESKPGEKTV